MTTTPSNNTRTPLVNLRPDLGANRYDPISAEAHAEALALAHAGQLFIKALSVVRHDGLAVDAMSALPTGPEHLHHAMLDELQFLLETLIAHAPASPGATPEALVTAVHRVLPATSVPAQDLLDAISDATHPSAGFETRVDADTRYWLRVTALAAAASASHTKDPDNWSIQLLTSAAWLSATG